MKRMMSIARMGVEYCMATVSREVRTWTEGGCVEAVASTDSLQAFIRLAPRHSGHSAKAQHSYKLSSLMFGPHTHTLGQKTEPF